jgi:hypothetical protein
MEEFKGTKGNWRVERTSTKNGDFQGRILCDSSEKTSHETNHTKPQVYIVVGEFMKKNGHANIHNSAHAKLIAAAPEMFNALQEIIKWYGFRNPKEELLPIEKQEKEIQLAIKAIEKATKK